MSNTCTNKNKLIVKNTFLLYVRMLFVLIVSLYSTRIVLNVLGIVDYGIFNVVAGFVSLFTFLNSTMTIGIQRFYNYENASSDNKLLDIYNTAIHIQIVIACVILIALETFGIWYINTIMIIPDGRITAANWIFQFSIFSLILVILQIPFSALIMAKERMGYYAIISIFDVILKLLTVVILPFINKDKLIFYGLLSLSTNAIDLLLYYIYCKRKFENLHFDLKIRIDLFKTMLQFSSWNVFGMFAYMIKGQGVNILLNAFFGPIVNAARGIAFQIMGAIQGFSNNIVTAFRPQLVSSYALGDFNRVKNLMNSMSKMSYVLLYILSVPITIELKYILNIWLNGIVPEYTILFTILVFADMLISSLNTPISQVIQAIGILKEYQIIRSVIITSIIPISWIVLKFGGEPESAFWISLILVIINQPVSMHLLHKIFPYSYTKYLKEVIIPCILFSLTLPIIPLFIHYWMDESFYRLIIIIITTVILSAILGYLLILNNSERNFLNTYIKKYIKY